VRAYGSSFFTLGISIRYLISLTCFFPNLLHFDLDILRSIPLFFNSGMADSFLNHHKI
jgi:hypothetical protein